jgi:hypothetical protein
MKRQARQSGEDGSVALEDDVVDEEEFELLTKVRDTRPLMLISFHRGTGRVGLGYKETGCVGLA